MHMPKNELDFYGRLLSIEQILKSVEGRIRAVEYRLSLEDEKNKKAVIGSEEVTNDLKKLLDSIMKKIFAVEELMKDLDNSRAKLMEEIQLVQIKNQELEKQIYELKLRKPSSKIPMDITGIVAAACMLIITALLATNNSGILQYPFFSMAMGLAFILAVASRLLIASK